MKRVSKCASWLIVSGFKKNLIFAKYVRYDLLVLTWRKVTCAYFINVCFIILPHMVVSLCSFWFLGFAPLAFSLEYLGHFFENMMWISSKNNCHIHTIARVFSTIQLNETNKQTNIKPYLREGHETLTVYVSNLSNLLIGAFCLTK